MADDTLTPAQIRYAARDVLYLPGLLETLRQRLMAADRWGLAAGSFAYLPTRVELDLLGCGDVFQY